MPLAQPHHHRPTESKEFWHVSQEDFRACACPRRKAFAGGFILLPPQTRRQTQPEILSSRMDQIGKTHRLATRHRPCLCAGQGTSCSTIVQQARDSAGRCRETSQAMREHVCIIAELYSSATLCSGPGQASPSRTAMNDPTALHELSRVVSLVKRRRRNKSVRRLVDEENTTQLFRMRQHRAEFITGTARADGSRYAAQKS
ncbi:hypothetical protein NUW54_g12994 [Trametes sanguinea]|uniref:Uncharacterized protein n=1 Tax=Trametes sanguinea TaxID=158606 RepID=A0ACC1MRH1_9APHY|nr:hypothetical protein NUW54_g12994 [Trametes sanguinea]